MFLVKLNGDIIKMYNEAKLNYLKSLGFFVTGNYLQAVLYSSCLINRGKDEKQYKYAKYF